jgi:hypothetical protein
MTKAQHTHKFCLKCGREVFGFWKYGPYPACSKMHFRSLIAEKVIPTLQPDVEIPELGILPPRRHHAIDRPSS